MQASDLARKGRQMKLQFTNGYRPRFDQISRILQYFLANAGRSRIPRQEIVAKLGIPDKQIENLTSMMTGFGLVPPRETTLTPLGRKIIQSDAYFEKIETLWIVHYVVSSNPEWVVWHRIINDIIPLHERFTVDYISTHFFTDLASHFSARTISKKLPKEVGAVFACYTRSNLSRLQILQEEQTGTFLRSNPVDIPNLAFLFCVLNYRKRYSPGSSAMNVEDIYLAENAPGRVLNLPEFQVRSLLEESHGNGFLRLERFANLDQVRFADAATAESLLNEIYTG